MLDNLPFELPNGWLWIRQSNLCWLDNGEKTKAGQLPYWEAKAIRNKKADSTLNEGVVVDPAFRLILVDGENSGEILIPPAKGYMGSTFKILRVTDQISFEYLLLLFEINRNLYKNNKVGAAIPHLNKKLFKENLIALPPLSEQKRIVQKTRCFDVPLFKYRKIETNLSELESNFEKKLKASILQYAIEGKLVKQDPNDEPASMLLERIKAEKDKLIKEGKIKRDKHDSWTISTDDKDYYGLKSIPRSWEWVLANQITKKIQYGLSVSGHYKGKYQLLRITDIQEGRVNWAALPYCDISEEKYEDYKICVNDIFIARTGGTIGKSFRLTTAKNRIVFAGYLIRIQLMITNLSQYIYFFFNSPFYWQQISNKSMGTGQLNINGVSLGKLLIPLPPLKEQTRINNKIEKIFNIMQLY